MGNIFAKKRSCDYLEDDHEGPGSNSSSNSNSSSSSNKRRRMPMAAELLAEVLSIIESLPNPTDTVEYINRVDRAFEIVVHEDPSLLALQPVIEYFMEVGRLLPSKLEQFIMTCKQQNLPERARNQLSNEVEERLANASDEDAEELTILIQQFPEILKGYSVDDELHDVNVSDSVLNRIWHRQLHGLHYKEVAAINAFMDEHLRWADHLDWYRWVEEMLSLDPSLRPPMLALRLAQIFVNDQSSNLVSASCTEDSNFDILLTLLPNLDELRYTPFQETSYNDPYVVGFGATIFPNRRHHLARLYASWQDLQPSSLVKLTIHISLDDTAEQAGTADLGKALRACPALLTLCLMPRNLEPEDIYDRSHNGLSYQKTVALLGRIAEEVSGLHQLQNLELALLESTYGQCGGVSVTDTFIKLFKMGLRSLKISGPPFEATVTDELREAIVSNMSLTTFRVMKNRNPSTSSNWDTKRDFVRTRGRYVDLARHYTRLNEVGRSRLWQKDVSADCVVKCVLEVASLWHPGIAVSVLHTMFCGNPALLAHCHN